MEKFVFKKSWADMLKLYDDNTRLNIYDAIVSLALGGGEISSFNVAIRPIMILINEDLKRMNEVYLKKSVAGQKGMRKRWTKNDDEEFKGILTEWNKIEGVIKCEILTDKAKENFTNLLKTIKKEDLFKCFLIVGECDFLLGKNPQGFKASIDWISRKDNYLKVMNGNYLNHNNNENLNEIWN